MRHLSLLELLGEGAFEHISLLASNLGKKASTNLGTIQDARKITLNIALFTKFASLGEKRPLLLNADPALKILRRGRDPR